MGWPISERKCYQSSMHLQTLAITINQSLIGHDQYYEAGFGAGMLQQEHFGNSQELEKWSSGWTILHPRTRTIDFGRWFFLFCWRFAGWCGILGLVQQLGTCRGKAPPSCYARPFCRLKAPLGLSLFCFAPQTRTCRGEAPPSCCRKTVRSLKSPTGAFIVPLRSTNANCLLLRLRRNKQHDCHKNI